MVLATSYGNALFGLVGVVIGGVITAGSNLLIERQRRGHEKEIQGERDKLELRAGVRLVLSELEEIDYAIRDAVRGRGFNPDKRLPAYAWADHKAILATRLEDSVWLSVTNAYRETNELNWRLAGRLVRVPLDNDEKEWFREPWLSVRGAQQALGPMIEPVPERAKGRVAAQQEVTAKVDKNLWPRFHRD